MASTEASQKDTSPNFYYEIKCMLYSFGDSKHPNSETVTLIEKIVHAQLTEVVSKAIAVSQTKGSRAIALEDILFLLRKNAAKLQTLLRHLQMKDMAKSANKLADRDSYEALTTPTKKRKMSLDFLSQSDQLLVESHQEQDVHLLQKMDEMTKDMNKADYSYYTRCRQVNFHKSTSKFSEWLGLNSLKDCKLTQEIIEVLGYLAYETVREIVSLSLLVKEDSERSGLLTVPSHSHHHYRYHSPPPCTPSKFGATPTFFTTPTEPGSSPPISPFTQPNTPQRDSSQSSTRAQRKQVSVPPLSLGTPSVLTRHMEGHTRSKFLLPRHVREAMRRYSANIGPMSPLSTHFSKPTFYKRTLCT